MTTLYRPVLIETVEQAEALPVRTPVLMGPFVAHRPFTDKGWIVTDAGGEYSTEELIAAHSHLSPVALVPIEAEEEWGLMDTDGTPCRAGSREHAQRWQQTIGTPLARRLVTPWEEA